MPVLKNSFLNIVVFSLTFSLPFYHGFSNWVLGIFYMTFLMLFLSNKNYYSIKMLKNKYVLLLVSFFFMTFLGIFYSNNVQDAFNQLIRMLPILLTPLVFLGFKGFYKKYSRDLLYGLVMGCIMAMIICWGNVIYEMISLNEPIGYLFRYRHINHQLSDVIDMHAGYLSLFVVTSIAILLNEYPSLVKKNKILANLGIIALSIFLFFLLSRTILLFYILSYFVFLFKKRLWGVLTIFFITITSLSVIVLFVKDENNYLKNKLYQHIPFIGVENQQDNRFKRLLATEKMFFNHPIFGVGTSNSEQYRQSYYKKIGDNRAYERKLNAHNQFFEYLDEFGLIGGCVYFLTFIIAARICWKQKDYFFLYIVVLFFVANLTESMLQRTHGIIYFSIFFSLIYSKHIIKLTLVSKETSTKYI